MYTIDQLALITGLTTRTLRNYLKSGILAGSRDTGIWQFTEQQVSDFIAHPSVKPSIQAKQKAIVYDFLAGQDNSDQEMCLMFHRRLPREEAAEISRFFCQAAGSLSRIRFSYSYEEGTAHFILKGGEEQVFGLLKQLRQRFPC